MNEEMEKQQMIIDIHTHTFPDKIAEKVIASLSAAAENTPPMTLGTEDSLIESMKAAGVTYSIVQPVATRPDQTESINRKVASVHERHPELISFGAMHAENENYKEIILNLKADGIRGIKLHPVYQNINFDDMRFMRIIDCCAENDMAMLVHAGKDIGFPDRPDIITPERIANVIRTLHPDKLILAHMAAWECWDRIDVMLEAGDFYADTAFAVKPDIDPQNYPRLMEKPAFEALVRKIGVDRVIFGSDSPWQGQKELVETIRSCNFTEEELEKIFWKNAEKMVLD